MYQPQYTLRLDTPSANRLILNNLGISQPPQQSTLSTTNYTPSFTPNTFYQSAFRPIDPDHHSSLSPNPLFSSPQYSQPQKSLYNSHASLNVHKSMPISPPIIFSNHQPINTSKLSTSIRIPDTVELHNSGMLLICYTLLNCFLYAPLTSILSSPSPSQEHQTRTGIKRYMEGSLKAYSIAVL
jgi:hypothetical protein